MPSAIAAADTTTVVPAPRSRTDRPSRDAAVRFTCLVSRSNASLRYRPRVSAAILRSRAGGSCRGAAAQGGCRSPGIELLGVELQHENGGALAGDGAAPRRGEVAGALHRLAIGAVAAGERREIGVGE